MAARSILELRDALIREPLQDGDKRIPIPWLSLYGTLMRFLELPCNKPFYLLAVAEGQLSVARVAGERTIGKVGFVSPKNLPDRRERQHFGQREIRRYLHRAFSKRSCAPYPGASGGMVAGMMVGERSASVAVFFLKHSRSSTLDRHIGRLPGLMALTCVPDVSQQYLASVLIPAAVMPFP